MERKNLSSIIHDLKLQYARIFREKYEFSPQLELIINISAKKIKQGGFGRWTEINNIRTIKFY